MKPEPYFATSHDVLGLLTPGVKSVQIIPTLPTSPWFVSLSIKCYGNSHPFYKFLNLIHFISTDLLRSLSFLQYSGFLLWILSLINAIHTVFPPSCFTMTKAFADLIHHLSNTTCSGYTFDRLSHGLLKYPLIGWTRALFQFSTVGNGIAKNIL